MRRCSGCGHAFLETPVASDDVELIYNDHYAGFRVDPVFRRGASGLLATEIASRLPPPARLLDVGCGNGEFLEIARDAGYEASGIDASESSGKLCRERGLDVRVGDLRAKETFAPDERFDLITFWDVVEHLPDPRSFLERAHALLRPGGYVLIKTPLTSTASIRLATAIPPLGRRLLSAPDHVQYFQRDALERLLRDAGFGTLHWLVTPPLRSPSTGGPLRRRIGRHVVRWLSEAAGNGSLLVMAERP